MLLYCVPVANMRAFFLNHLGKNLLRLLVAVLLVFSVQLSRADQLSLVPMPPTDKEPEWLLGSGKANLADFAKMDVPDGYRFCGPIGARTLLLRMRNPVPPNLVGILAPNTGKWWIVLSFSDIGYVKGMDRNTRIDAESVLNLVRENLETQNELLTRQGMSPIASVDWASKPVFDASRGSLEWAIRAETRTEKIVNLRAEMETQGVINHTVRLLGRRGALDATAVELDTADAEVIPLKDLVNHITFNRGEAYTDYQSGDKVAKLRVEEIIAGVGAKKPTPAYLIPAIWAGAVVLAGVLVASSILLARRILRKQKMSRAFPDYEEHGYALAQVLSKAQNGSGNHSGARRRRTFDYHRYYSDMMVEVSGGSYSPNLTANGKPVSREVNGKPAAAANGANHSMVQANSELIANQMRLIEEQKRLLQEQAKLIEEKSKLIQERNQLLEKQSELLERDVV
jgi:uncharacterized membrane-anchored protein